MCSSDLRDHLASAGPGRRSHAATGREAPIVPRQLPADAYGFVGRQTELALLDTMARAAQGGRLVVISGPPGVGKTALAVHWGHRMVDAFPDGQLYVNLRGYDLARPLTRIEALGQLLHGLAVPDGQIPSDDRRAAALYRSLLAGRRILVILDNARTADQVRPLLPGDGTCFTLVTSRDRLAGLVARDGARPIDLDVLTPTEASALMGELTGGRSTDAPAAALDELVRACGLLPLALRIAAANIVMRPGLTVTDYLAQLTDGPSGNRISRLAVADDEQTAVRVAFDQSYLGLPEPTRRVFGLLALLPTRTVTATDAAALTGDPAAVARQAVQRLADASLLTYVAPDRYGFHDLLRLYASDRVRADQPAPSRTAALRRWYDWQLARLGEAAQLLYPQMVRLTPVEPDGPRWFADSGAALAWLDAVRPDLVAAIMRAEDLGVPEMAWRLADLLRGHFIGRPNPIDWLNSAEAANTAARTAADPRARAATELNLGMAAMSGGDRDRAVAHFVRALDRSRRANWAEGEACVRGKLGVAYSRMGRLDEAAAQMTRALEISRQVDAPMGEAVNLNNLATVHIRAGRLADAQELLQQALALHRSHRSRRGEAAVLINLGRVNHQLGYHDAALGELTAALALQREVGSVNGAAAALSVLAAIHSDLGNPGEALRAARTAMALLRPIADDNGYSIALNVLGALRHRYGRHRLALLHHTAALRLARTTENLSAELDALLGLATVRVAAGDLEGACRHAELALRIATRTGCRMEEGRAFTALAEIALADGQFSRAAGYVGQALAVHEPLRHQLAADRARALLDRMPTPSRHVVVGAFAGQ